MTRSSAAAILILGCCALATSGAVAQDSSGDSSDGQTALTAAQEAIANAQKAAASNPGASATLKQAADAINSVNQPACPMLLCTEPGMPLNQGCSYGPPKTDPATGCPTQCFGPVVCKPRTCPLLPCAETNALIMPRKGCHYGPVQKDPAGCPTACVGPLVCGHGLCPDLNCTVDIALPKGCHYKKDPDTGCRTSCFAPVVCDKDPHVCPMLRCDIPIAIHPGCHYGPAKKDPVTGCPIQCWGPEVCDKDPHVCPMLECNAVMIPQHPGCHFGPGKKDPITGCQIQCWGPEVCDAPKTTWTCKSAGVVHLPASCNPVPAGGNAGASSGEAQSQICDGHGVLECPLTGGALNPCPSLISYVNCVPSPYDGLVP